jgi:hypothetical protein
VPEIVDSLCLEVSDPRDFDHRQRARPIWRGRFRKERLAQAGNKGGAGYLTLVVHRQGLPNRANPAWQRNELTSDA